jgi:hypothetical protein
MKRVAGILLLVTVALAQTVAPIQPEAVTRQDRAPYQAAYRNWRAADPNLEHDSATAGATLGARADKVAPEAAKYYAARKAYLDGLQADAEQKAVAIEALPAPPEPDGNPARYAASQNSLISASIDAIANDPDRAIQRLRVALERERTALAALSSALTDTQNGRDTVQRAATAAEESRGKVAQHYHALSASLKQSASQTGQTGTLWADYYRTFSDGARGVMSRDSVPVTPAAAPPAPVSVVAGTPSVAPNMPANSTTGGATSSPVPVLRTRSIAPLPLARYIGSWVYPTVGAEYHGTEPESVDMVVREDNGQAKGTFFVRFKLASNNRTEPTVRFDFEGPFQSSRNQSFALVTSNGAKGTMELIPGTVFNLIEVHFSTEDKPNTIRQGNFLLIKK